MFEELAQETNFASIWRVPHELYSHNGQINGGVAAPATELLPISRNNGAGVIFLDET